MSEIIHDSVEQRLSSNLLRILSRDEKKSQEIRMTRRDLADLCGTTLFTVSRILQRWERAGMVKSSRQYVKIMQFERLQGLGGFDSHHRIANNNAAR